MPKPKIQKPRRKPAQTSVPERGVLDFFEHVDIHALFGENAPRFFQHAELHQIIIKAPTDEILHGKIVGVALLFCRNTRRTLPHGKLGNLVIKGDNVLSLYVQIPQFL